MASIMVIAAHPQDPFERAGGAAAKHLDNGDDVMFVSLTAGVVTHAFGVFPETGDDKLAHIEEVKETKRQEFEDAARVLGLTDWRVLDFPESPMLLGLEEYIVLVDLIRQFRPNAVLCHHPVEVGRQDHMDAGRYALAAVDYARADGFPSSLAPHTVSDIFMFYYPDFRAEQLIATSRSEPQIVLDITDVIDKKKEARKAFWSTQSKEGETPQARLDRLNRFHEVVEGQAGYMHGFRYAERYVRWNPETVQLLPLS